MERGTHGTGSTALLGRAMNIRRKFVERRGGGEVHFAHDDSVRLAAILNHLEQTGAQFVRFETDSDARTNRLVMAAAFAPYGPGTRARPFEPRNCRAPVGGSEGSFSASLLDERERRRQRRLRNRTRKTREAERHSTPSASDRRSRPRIRAIPGRRSGPRTRLAERSRTARLGNGPPRRAPDAGPEPPP